MATMSPLGRRMIEEGRSAICRRRHNDRTSMRYRSSVDILAGLRIGLEDVRPFQVILWRQGCLGRR